MRCTGERAVAHAVRGGRIVAHAVHGVRDVAPAAHGGRILDERSYRRKTKAIKNIEGNIINSFFINDEFLRYLFII